MEILQDAFLRELHGGNQALSTSDNSFDEHKFGTERLTENGRAMLREASNVANPQGFPTQTPSFPSRKVHSAAPTWNGFGLGDVDDIPRPYTAFGADESLSSSTLVSRPRKKKLVTAHKKTPRDSNEERPRSADVNEWGDFDTDRLLRDDFEDLSNQNALDPLDGQRARSRKSRRSTPATPSPRTDPWEGYLTLNNESKESSKPPMQVLRQKTIEILNLDLVAQANQPSGRSSATPKPLLGRASLERLTPSRSRSVTSLASRPATSTPLFGKEIPNTPSNRATIFGRIAILWSLVPDHSSISTADHLLESEAAEAMASSADTHTKSPFECNMTMVKLCKTVGISLAPSAATRLSFWDTNNQYVDFESFCDLAIQGAIQPALHHFKLDNSIEEYVSALDTIVQSLVTIKPARRHKNQTAPSGQLRCLKEPNEIQPVFMSWKADLTPRLVQPAEDPVPIPTKALVTAERARRVLETSVSQHMLAYQLPSEEARVTHVENIRRKVQLHKSWKLSAESKLIDRGISSPKIQVSRGGLISSHEQRISTSKAADLAEMLDRARTVFPITAGFGDLCSRDERKGPEPHDKVLISGLANDAVPEEVDAQNQEVLVCCSCSSRAAVLWCASCFTVSCQMCWQVVHSCTVDMSMISSESSAARKPLLGPTALAMKKKHNDSAMLRPLVAMIYLPTKAMVPGTLIRGNPVHRHSNVRRNNSIQTTFGDVKDEIPAVVANAILPSLHKSRSTGAIPRRHEHPQVENILTSATDSTANLVKSLMLRVSPSTTPTSASRSTGSHTLIESAMRVHKHHTPARAKLRLAPVSFDAQLILSHTPDQRR